VPPVPPRITLPAVSVAVLVNVIVPVLVVLPNPPTVSVPDTVSEGFVPENVSVPVLLLVALPTVKVVQEKEPFTVTVYPLSIITISAAPGKTPAPTEPPPDVVDHVVLVPQFPFCLE